MNQNFYRILNDNFNKYSDNIFIEEESGEKWKYTDIKKITSAEYDRYRLLNTVANAAWNSGEAVAGSGTVDYFMVHPGRTYCIPLISINTSFGSFEDNSLIQSYYRDGGDLKARNAYYFWWTHERDRFTLDDFFTYGNAIDSKMTLDTDKFLHYDISGEMYKLYGEPYLNRYRTK